MSESYQSLLLQPLYCTQVRDSSREKFIMRIYWIKYHVNRERGMPYITLHGMLHYYFFLLFITLHIHKNLLFSLILLLPFALLLRWKQWGWKFFVQALEKKSFHEKAENKKKRKIFVSFTQRIQESFRFFFSFLFVPHTFS